MSKKSSYTFCEDLYSDLYKDANGFRPRDYTWSNWKKFTDDQKQVEWDRLIALLDFNMHHEAKASLMAQKNLELQIQQNISSGAVSRETALRWIVQAENPEGYEAIENGTLDFALYSLGIDFDFFHLYDKNLHHPF